MKFTTIVITVLFLVSCQESATHQVSTEISKDESTISGDEFTLVFASCNDPHRPQLMWEPILENKPDAFIWGGDNIYADTEDMEKMKADYDLVLANKEYQRLKESTPIYGTWDDHDYGKNDAGKEWSHKEQAKELFLDFLGTYNSDVLNHPGVYTSYKLKGTNEENHIKLILLDTRTFRDGLKKSEDPDKRYEAWEGSEGGTILGVEQWSWLEKELQDSDAAFTIIVSSIQFLNNNHGWEKWGNHPSEMLKLEAMIQKAQAKNIIVLSGDRHMAEISKKSIADKSYPLIDFTTSGLTHTWIDGATEKNQYRISNVIKHLNFGVLRFNFKEQSVTYEIRGKDNFLFETYTQSY